MRMRGKRGGLWEWPGSAQASCSTQQELVEPRRRENRAKGEAIRGAPQQGDETRQGQRGRHVERLFEQHQELRKDQQ